MVVALNPEQELVVAQAIEAGIVHGPDEAVELGIGTIRQRLESASQSEEMSAEEWSRRLHAWGDSHPTDTPLLSDEAISRESIYGDRGL